MAKQCPTGICMLPSLRERERRAAVWHIKTMVSKEWSLIPVGGARGKGNMYATLPNAQTARGFFFWSVARPSRQNRFLCSQTKAYRIGWEVF